MLFPRRNLGKFFKLSDTGMFEVSVGKSSGEMEKEKKMHALLLNRLAFNYFTLIINYV